MMGADRTVCVVAVRYQLADFLSRSCWRQLRQMFLFCARARLLRKEIYSFFTRNLDRLQTIKYGGYPIKQ